MKSADIDPTKQVAAGGVILADGAVPHADAPGNPPPDAGTDRASFIQNILMVFGAIAFLYFARPIVLPIFLAVIAAMTLKPMIRWMSDFSLQPSISLINIGLGLIKIQPP